jgi:hypothetical protein
MVARKHNWILEGVWKVGINPKHASSDAKEVCINLPKEST